MKSQPKKLYRTMKRKRANVTIDPELHESAMTHARDVHGTDFSGLVTKLLIEDLGEAYLRSRLNQSAESTSKLQNRLSDEEKGRLPYGPRAIKRNVVDPVKSRSKKPEAIAAKKAALAARKEVDSSRQKAAAHRR